MIAMKKFVNKAAVEKKIKETKAAEIDGALHNSGYWDNLEKSHESEAIANSSSEHPGKSNKSHHESFERS